MKYKKINFFPSIKTAEIAGIEPKPSIKFLPDWYKDIPPLINDAKKLSFLPGSGSPNVTIKKCIPFLDAMTIGYMAVLEDDILVEKLNGFPYISWRANQEVLITDHAVEQYNGIPIPEGYSSAVFKWNNNWTIELPAGYSAFFTHPNNRLDLPFYTLSGVVDCDQYNVPVQFPFIIKDSFNGIIKSGTPICQIIPFKRESWKSVRDKHNQEKGYLNQRIFNRTFISSYKKNYWSKKSFE